MKIDEWRLRLVLLEKNHFNRSLNLENLQYNNAIAFLFSRGDSIIIGYV